ncbi:unnamed protein product [Trichogramma brassicae]|uniref:Uncharacterized protein n=1 Tax=Trichogramma brassicae TaxID=86971 RepID=A0A6H5I165_9HYME|nr:unnamed protein product [Trichogramma brassicae]
MRPLPGTRSLTTIATLPQLELPSGPEDHPERPMMRILHLNLNHCEAAQDLLCDTISKHHIDRIGRASLTAEDMASEPPVRQSPAHVMPRFQGKSRRRRSRCAGGRPRSLDLRRSVCGLADSSRDREAGQDGENPHARNYASQDHLLRVAINTRQASGCWRQHCDEVNSDVWGKPIQIAMSRLRCPATKQRHAPLSWCAARWRLCSRVSERAPPCNLLASIGGAYNTVHTWRTQRSPSVEESKSCLAPGPDGIYANQRAKSLVAVLPEHSSCGWPRLVWRLTYFHLRERQSWSGRGA